MKLERCLKCSTPTEDVVHTDELQCDLVHARKQIVELEQWVHDLQSGMYVNCVYCGHRYGPDGKVAPAMQQALYDHIAECPKHPLSAAKAWIAELEEALRSAAGSLEKAGWLNTARCARKVLDHEQR